MCLPSLISPAHNLRYVSAFSHLPSSQSPLCVCLFLSPQLTISRLFLFCQLIKTLISLMFPAHNLCCVSAFSHLPNSQSPLSGFSLLPTPQSQLKSTLMSCYEACLLQF
ncbi:hypothetical protein BsWGS_22033 [Bradybaena similaris]